MPHPKRAGLSFQHEINKVKVPELIVREVSFCNRGGQIQRPTAQAMQRMEDLRTLRPKRDVSIKSLPSGLKRMLQKRRQKELRVKGDGGHQ